MYGTTLKDIWIGLKSQEKKNTNRIHNHHNTHYQWNNLLKEQNKPTITGAVVSTTTYNNVCNQCTSLLKMWVRIPPMARCNRYNTMWESLSVTCDRSAVIFTYWDFPLALPDCYDISEILLKVVLSTNSTIILAIITIYNNIKNNTKYYWMVNISCLMYTVIWSELFYVLRSNKLIFRSLDQNHLRQ